MEPPRLTQQVGIASSIQTHGSLANWHPHLHLLFTDGVEQALTAPRPDDGRLNVIELCHGQNCPDLPERKACSASDDWWAKITRADDGAVKSRCVSRCDLSAASVAEGFSVPGTARWRWLAQDEQTRMWCAQGCCETR
jgi:hypothetical protein